MPIAICAKCGKPTPSSFYRFNKICTCIDWKAKAKRMGWNLIFPDEDRGNYIDVDEMLGEMRDNLKEYMSKTKTTIVNKKTDKYDVYIGRPSKWQNPFVIGKDGNREEVIKKYEKYLRSNKELMSCIMELDGKILGCWCKPKACHGDIIIKIINEKKIKAKK